MKNNHGFTLIEVLIYLALFAILLVGILAAAYSVIESSGRNQAKIVVISEGNFLVGKINWALSGAQAVNLPFVGTSGSVLSINKITGIDPVTGQPITTSILVALSGADITIQEGGNPAEKLNTSNVAVSNLLFTHVSDSGDGINPESVSSTFTVSARTEKGVLFSEDFATKSFMRK